MTCGVAVDYFYQAREFNGRDLKKGQDRARQPGLPQCGSRRAVWSPAKFPPAA